MGHRVRIYPPVSIRYPSQIWIGDEVEVRAGSCLYGRSDQVQGIFIDDRCRIKEYCVLDAYGGFIRLGKQVLIGQGMTIHGHGGVFVNDFTLIGAQTCIFSNNHNFDDIPVLIQEQGETFKATTVGRNVWIGANATILAGVTIGDNSVVAAGAVVCRDVPPLSVAAGVPATVIRTLDSRLDPT